MGLGVTGFFYREHKNKTIIINSLSGKLKQTQEERDALEKAKTEAEKTNVTLNQSLAYNRAKYETLEKKVERQGSKIENYKQEIEQTKNELEARKSRIDSLAEEKTELEETLEKTKTETNETNDALKKQFEEEKEQLLALKKLSDQKLLETITTKDTTIHETIKKNQQLDENIKKFRHSFIQNEVEKKRLCKITDVLTILLRATKDQSDQSTYFFEKREKKFHQLMFWKKRWHMKMIGILQEKNKQQLMEMNELKSDWQENNEEVKEALENATRIIAEAHSENALLKSLFLPQTAISTGDLQTLKSTIALSNINPQESVILLKVAKASERSVTEQSDSHSIPRTNWQNKKTRAKQAKIARVSRSNSFSSLNSPKISRRRQLSDNLQVST